MICCSINAECVEGALNDIYFAKSKSDLVEVRLDKFKECNLDMVTELIEKKPLPMVMTCRKKDEGGDFKGNESLRAEILHQCIKLGVDYVDLEYSAGEAFIKEVCSGNKKSKIIISYHNFELFPSNIREIVSEMREIPHDIIKIACNANSIEDNLAMFKLIEELKGKGEKVIGICMGEIGSISRILGLLKGSFCTYGCLNTNKSTAPGQLSVEHLKRLYRVNRMNKETKIYGLVGNPVNLSRGIFIHNLAFKEYDINAVYINFLTKDITRFMELFKEVFSGLSVTMPFKEDAFKLMDELDDSAKGLDAVNTILRTSNGLRGFNTDGSATIKALEEVTDLKEKKVLLIGAGGMARAIGFSLRGKCKNIILTNRTQVRGEALARKIGAQFVKKNDLTSDLFDVVINATSVGMHSDNEGVPISPELLRGKIVLDSVYNPAITKLLDAAEKKGSKTITGLKIFTYQAEGQFKIWTGKDIDLENIVTEYLL